MSEVFWHLPRWHAHVFVSFIFERDKVRKKRDHIVSTLSIFRWSRAHCVLDLHSLSSTFFWFLPSFFISLCLDPAEPPRANGKWGLSVVLTWDHKCSSRLLSLLRCGPPDRLGELLLLFSNSTLQNSFCVFKKICATFKSPPVDKNRWSNQFNG